MELKEKKLTMKNIEPNELDFETLHLCRLERGDVIQDQKLRQKFVLPEVSDLDHRVPKS